MSTPTYTLWSAMPAPLANEILVTVQKTNKKIYKTVLELMAPRMGIRVPILIEMPKVQRHATWIQIIARPEMEGVSFNLLSTWLIETQRPMLCAWLDALGIKHAENGCADTFPPEPDAALLKKGVNLLLEKFDPTLVAIYLRTFNQIDETQWPALEELIQKEPKLQIKDEAVVKS